MASKTTQGYQPIACPDWHVMLQSLVYPNVHCIGSTAEERGSALKNYIHDLEHCVKMTNSAIEYYEKLTANYDRLVSVMEESRNFAYDTIGSLKDEINIAKKCRPLIYVAEDAKEAKNA